MLLMEVLAKQYEHTIGLYKTEKMVRGFSMSGALSYFVDGNSSDCHWLWNFQYGSIIVFSLSLEIQLDMPEWISSPVDIARKDVDTTNG